MKTPGGRRIGWRLAAGALGGLLVLAVARPTVHVARTALRERAFGRLTPAWGPERVEDVSRLDGAPVQAVYRVPGDEAAAIDLLRRLLREAREQHVSVSIAGARHSMGGHTFAPGGIVVDMQPFRAMALDRERRILRIQSGARWEDVIPFLGAQGLSVSVMQSDSAFTVGGSLSVNCHGWQNDRPPIASTVESFRLLLADGRVVRCSRTENRELFSAALGGYGLFGIILDADLRVVPDARYRIDRKLLPSGDYVRELEAALRSGPVGLAYGRLNVTRHRFLEEAELTTFAGTSDASPGEPIAELAPWAVSLERWIFRGSQGSEYGKELRWSLETSLSPWFFSRSTHRNAVMQSRVELYENRDPAQTDILQEYFVPRERLEEFLVKVRAIVPAHPADLLNVTLRDVRRDDDTLLRYADRDAMALVFFFAQPRTAEAEGAMQALTRELIDASFAVGGRYYLPYRSHATRSQFERAYPEHEAFFSLKRAVDPDEIFQNQFYRTYGPPPLIQAAADAAVRGEIDEARRLVDGVLASDATNAEAVFVRACNRLQAGDLKGEREDSDRLEALRGPILEVRVLRELAIARGHAPPLGWASAFLAALKKSGATGKEPTLLQFVPTSRKALSPEVVRALPGGEGFLLRVAEAGREVPPALLDEAERIAAGEHSTVVLLAAASILGSPHVAAADRGRAAAAAHALIARLARENPRERSLQLWAALSEAPESAPLAEADVVKLEQIAASAPIDLPLTTVYETMRRAYAKVDPGQASQAGFQTIFGFYPPPSAVVLLRRTKPMIGCGDPSLRRRAGLAIARLGREVMARGSLLEWGTGTMLLGRGAALSGDPALAEEDARKRGEFRALLSVASDRWKFPSEWPIAGLMADFTALKTRREAELYGQLP